MIDPIIEMKRAEVLLLYSKYGHSALYIKAFNELHELNMELMAKQYRKERSLQSEANPLP